MTTARPHIHRIRSRAVRPHGFATALVLGLAGVLPAAAGPVTHRVVALTGSDGPLGPRLGAGVSYFLISATPVIDDAGRVLFTGFV
jgi:hypothetical protein